ncbi:MAG: acetolactate synthase small subunit [Bacillota bacterium]|nr:acetolactate synthase small subunit [Clostridiales bacterium]MDD6764465.1 acetolactate synthase small subunit [Bacillota bacterium]MDY5606289.1 acetolactate synthase small subunit [Lentihominibacter sp.]MCI7392083.1 acetolactate synthase small subunit [Clostridiales bacterium]MDD6978682.1 acetolactate synthase small subunit [Bacillota bacterium]
MNYDKSFRRRWLSLFVENQIGVLARISGLLSGKSYNIHSLTVGETQDRAISRMTVCLDADDKTFEQIMKQLNRSIEVIKVIDITDASIRSKEVMFIKIKGINERDRAEVFQMAQAFKFRIKDMDHNSVLVEAVRTEIVNDSILNLINERFKNIEVVRGGPVAIESISMQDR